MYNSAVGAIGGAFACEDARLILAGRSRAALDELADALGDAGGLAQVAVVDALDAAAVDAVIEEVVAQAGQRCDARGCGQRCRVRGLSSRAHPDRHRGE